MASLLRQIVSGPRARHPEAGLDLCYVTNNIIATSGPSGTYPQLAYRNPLKQLVKFLDDKHGEEWAIWEFRAEGTGYPDSEVYNRIYHYPWPDHHPPPFALIPLIMGSMRNWLKGDAPANDGAEDDDVDKDLTRSGSQEHLALKLEAVQLEQGNGMGLSGLDDQKSVDPETPASKSDEFHDAPTNQQEDSTSSSPKNATHATGTSETSPNNSGRSTPSSATKRKKNVRWRESTLLPPKTTTAIPSTPPAPQNSTFESPAPTPSTAAATPAHKKPDHTKRVVVVHCKAGKGRSGTVSCSYLISEEGWSMASALQRFTERRMRPGFGAGVSIPSQLRWISYVDRWTRHGKRYVERQVEIVEVHVWGLRDRVKVAIEGFREEGKRIEVLHSFTKEEREVVRAEGEKKAPGFKGVVEEVVQQEKERKKAASENGVKPGEAVAEQAAGEIKRARTTHEDLGKEGEGGDVVFRPKERVVCESSDVNVDFERRNKGVSGLTMITSVAHVWFNAFFEGDGPERDGDAFDSGVFELEWDKMDGIKGSTRKGTRAFDRIAVVWKVVKDGVNDGVEIRQPGPGEGVQDTEPADWGGNDEEDEDRGRVIGVERESLSSRESSSFSKTPSKRNTATADGSEKKVAVPA